MKQCLKVGADPFPPYQYVDKDGKIHGLDYELVKKVLEDMGYDAEFIIDDWSKILKMFENKQLDLIFQVQKTPERERKWYFSDKLRDAITVVITSKNNKVKVKDLNDFIGKMSQHKWKLGVVKSYKYGEPFDSIPDQYKVFYSSNETLVTAVNNEKVMFGVIDLGVLNYLVEKHGLNNIRIVDNAKKARPLYVAFNDPLLRDEFNKHLKKYVQ